MNGLCYFVGCQYLIGIRLKGITYQFCCDRIVSDDQELSIAKLTSLSVIVFRSFASRRVMSTGRIPVGQDTRTILTPLEAFDV